MKIFGCLLVTAALIFGGIGEGVSQPLEKLIITHSSESISITPLLYGIEKGFYKKEGVDLQFRVLRGDLAVSSIVAGRDIDYMYGAGTAVTAAVRGLPMKVLSHDLKSVLFYLMAQPTLKSPQELKGKRVAVASLGGTGAVATRASIRALGLDPERDVTYIVIGAASVRLAAMETGSVDAAIMPVPWNIRMKQKGFKELIFAGKVMSQPLTGVATSKERIEQNPEQVKRVLKGFVRSLRAVKAERHDVVEFIGRKYSLDPASADETYKILLQTLSDDGTVPDPVLKDLLDQTKQEAGVKKELAIKEIIDYTWVRQVAKEIGPVTKPQ